MKKIALVVAVSLAMAACHDSNSDVARVAPAAQAVAPVAAVPGQAAPQTVVVQQPAQQSSSTGDLLTGAALGAMATHLFSGGSRAAPAAAPTQIIERRTIIKQVERPAARAPAPTVAAAPKAAPSYGSSFSKPASKPSYGSSFSSGSRSSSSSFSSSRSSFGGRR